MFVLGSITRRKCNSTRGRAGARWFSRRAVNRLSLILYWYKQSCGQGSSLLPKPRTSCRATQAWIQPACSLASYTSPVVCCSYYLVNCPNSSWWSCEQVKSFQLSASATILQTVLMHPDLVDKQAIPLQLSTFVSFKYGILVWWAGASSHVFETLAITQTATEKLILVKNQRFPTRLYTLNIQYYILQYIRQMFRKKTRLVHIQLHK